MDDVCRCLRDEIKIMREDGHLVLTCLDSARYCVCCGEKHFMPSGHEHEHERWALLEAGA